MEFFEPWVTPLLIPGIIPNLLIEIVTSVITVSSDTVVGAVPTIAETTCHLIAGEAEKALVHVWDTAIANPISERVDALADAALTPVTKFLAAKVASAGDISGMGEAVRDAAHLSKDACQIIGK